MRPLAGIEAGGSGGSMNLRKDFIKITWAARCVDVLFACYHRHHALPG